MIHIRTAHIHDAGAIARVHAATWKEVYRGLIDESYLGALSPARLTERWRTQLTRRSRNFDEETFVAVRHGAVIGFATVGASRETSAPWDSEIEMIYLLADQRGAGVGRGLMTAAADHSLRRGMFSTGLWVLKGNRTGRAFYEALEGKAFGAKSERVGACDAQLISYYWDDVSTLASCSRRLQSKRQR